MKWDILVHVNLIRIRRRLLHNRYSIIRDFIKEDTLQGHYFRFWFPFTFKFYFKFFCWSQILKLIHFLSEQERGNSEVVWKGHSPSVSDLFSQVRYFSPQGTAGSFKRTLLPEKHDLPCFLVFIMDLLETSKCTCTCINIDLFIFLFGIKNWMSWIY